MRSRPSARCIWSATTGGSIQGWEFVTDPRLQGRIASFTSCSGPCLDHAAIALRELRGQRSLAALGQALRQLMASWYIGVFHLPWLPELAWRLWLGRAWPRYLRLTEGVRARPNPIQTADGCHGLRLYRANILPVLRAPRRRAAHAPVQLIVPLRDRYVKPAATEGMHRWTPRLWRRTVRARHWLPLAHPGGLPPWSPNLSTISKARRPRRRCTRAASNSRLRHIC